MEQLLVYTNKFQQVYNDMGHPVWVARQIHDKCEVIELKHRSRAPVHYRNFKTEEEAKEYFSKFKNEAIGAEYMNRENKAAGRYSKLEKEAVEIKDEDFQAPPKSIGKLIRERMGKRYPSAFFSSPIL